MRDGAGSVRVSRSLFDDEAFKDEPMTEREAFLWLIMEASFKGREKRAGSVVVTLKRGQLAASTRFMGKAWGWPEARVRRYLDRLKNRRMVECVADAGVTVVTVCNYDKYQAPERVTDAASTHMPTQHRRTADANENKDEIREEVETNVSTKRVSALDHLSSVVGTDLAHAFIAHRKAMRAPMTDQAGKLMAKKLAAMSDPGASVEQSITRGWKDVFAVAEVHQFPSTRKSHGERTDDAFKGAGAFLAQRPFD